MTAKLLIPEGYKADNRGRLIPVGNIRDIDLARDDLVLELIKKAQALQADIKAFKATVFGDIAAFVDLSAERYDVVLGGRRGNVTLSSFDGKQKVQFAINDRLTFDEGLLAAKALIDECLHEWTAGASNELKAIVDRAFDVDKEGNLNTNRILSLRRVAIDDERWLRAMKAISDSIQVADSKAYVRFYERPSADARFQAISLDIASV